MGSGAFLVEACRQLGDGAGRGLARTRRPAAISRRRGRGDLRAAARRAALPVRRRPQPGRGRPREDVAVARDARARAPAHVPRPRAAPRRLARRARPPPDRVVPLEAAAQPGLEAIRIGGTWSGSAELRTQIREAGDDTPDWTLRDMWDEAQHGARRRSRLFGDLAVAASSLATSPPRARTKRVEFATPSRTGDAGDDTLAWSRSCAHGEPAARAVPLADRVPGGVRPRASGVRRDRRQPAVRWQEHARRGEPRRTTPTGSSRSIRRATATPTSSRTSSAARSTCCGRTGTFGLIATNTIGQGDTRATGLRWICTHGGEIYAARKRVKWPGTSGGGRRQRRPRCQRASAGGSRCSTGGRSSTITAFLFHRRRPRRPGAACGERRQELPGQRSSSAWGSRSTTPTRRASQLRSREMRRLIDERPDERRGDLPVHRRRGGQQQPDARASPVRDQLRRARPRRSAADAGRS